MRSRHQVAAVLASFSFPILAALITSTGRLMNGQPGCINWSHSNTHKWLNGDGAVSGLQVALESGSPATLARLHGADFLSQYWNKWHWHYFPPPRDTKHLQDHGLAAVCVRYWLDPRWVGRAWCYVVHREVGAELGVQGPSYNPRPQTFWVYSHWSVTCCHHQQPFTLCIRGGGAEGLPPPQPH